MGGLGFAGSNSTDLTWIICLDWCWQHPFTLKNIGILCCFISMDFLFIVFSLIHIPFNAIYLHPHSLVDASLFHLLLLDQLLVSSDAKTQAFICDQSSSQSGISLAQILDIVTFLCLFTIKKISQLFC